MTENVPLENLKTGKQEKSCCYFKTKVLETHSSKEINEVVKQNIDNQNIVFAYQSTSYVDIFGFCIASHHEKIE